MRIAKDKVYVHTCSKCGRTDFDFMEKGGQLGIYCTTCGRWLKWADKDEQNLYRLNRQGK